MEQTENTELRQNKTAECFANNDEAHKKELCALRDYERTRDIIDDTLRVINKATKDGDYTLAIKMIDTLTQKQRDMRDASSIYAFAQQKRESAFHQLHGLLAEQIPREEYEQYYKQK